MKSAYELAMERMAAEAGPSKTLTEDEKRQCAEIDQKFDGRVAETKLSYDAKIASASPAEVDGVKSELAADLARLEALRDKEKDSIWGGA